MTIAGTAFIIGAFWQAAAKRHVALLLTGRVFWGVGVGFADQSVTIYNAELAPQQWRGRLHLLIQLATVIGKYAITVSHEVSLCLQALAYYSNACCRLLATFKSCSHLVISLCL